MYLEEFQKDLERALIELNMYGILAQLVEHLTFNQVVRGSNPRCLINSEKRHSYEWRFFVRKNICKAAINAGVVGRMKQHGNVKSDEKSKEK